jgi:hypothetical protein
MHVVFNHIFYNYSCFLSIIYSRRVVVELNESFSVEKIQAGADWPIGKSGIFPMGRSLFGPLYIII